MTGDGEPSRPRPPGEPVCPLTTTISVALLALIAAVVSFGHMHELAYALDPGGGHRLHTLQVITITGGRVAHNVMFADPPVFI